PPIGSSLTPRPKLCHLLNSRLLSRLRLPVGRSNFELLCILSVQLLPTGRLNRLSTSDAADGISAEKPIENIESNVPAGGAPGDETAIDVGPQRQARAASKAFEFPPDIAVLKYLGGVGSCDRGFDRRRRPHPRELHRGSSGTQVPIDIEGRPLAQMLRI